MSDGALGLLVFLNQVANTIGGILLAPIGILPESVAAMMVMTVTGIVTLVAFKHTSNQVAIKRVRNRIKSELLALSLFNESVAVNLGSQGRILFNALRLALLSLVPMAIMLVPFSLFVGQLSLWWQARPLRIGEEAVVTLNLAAADQNTRRAVTLVPTSVVEATMGPIRVRSQQAICWSVKAKEPGYHRIAFDVDGQRVEKELAVGDRPMRVSSLRPDWKWTDVLFNPAEAPFRPQSAVRSIEIQYPANSYWSGGTFSWMIMWLIGSTVAALCLRRVFNVNF